ncbi:MAG: DUF3276 family protein [Treponema sp.]|nr:DUF3276 family protein [Treponema sp.]
MGIRGELFSTKVSLQNRTYFFNVKENRLGDLYLNIVESKNRDEGGFERQSVILFADDLQEFLKGFDESLRVLEKAAREKKRGPSGRSFGFKGNDGFKGSDDSKGGYESRGNGDSSESYGSGRSDDSRSNDGFRGSNDSRRNDGFRSSDDSRRSNDSRGNDDSRGSDSFGRNGNFKPYEGSDRKGRDRDYPSRDKSRSWDRTGNRGWDRDKDGNRDRGAYRGGARSSGKFYGRENSERPRRSHTDQKPGDKRFGGSREDGPRKKRVVVKKRSQTGE